MAKCAIMLALLKDKVLNGLCFWIFPSKTHVEIYCLASNGLEDGAHLEVLSCEDPDLAMVNTDAWIQCPQGGLLIKDKEVQTPFSLVPVLTALPRWYDTATRGPLTRCGPLILDFPASETVPSKLLFFTNYSVCGVIIASRKQTKTNGWKAWRHA